MDKIDMIYDDLQEAKKDIKTLLQRMTKIEVKSAIFGGMCGTVFGALVSLFTKGVL